MRLLGCVPFLCCVLCALSQSQPRARAEFEQKGGLITVEADRLFRQSLDLWVAEGSVVIIYQDMVLNAPRITYKPVSNEVEAQGPVEIRRGFERLKGSAARLNLNTDTGIINDAEGHTEEQLYIQAKRLIKTGRGKYTAQDGFLTACEEAIPKWSFTVKSADVTAGGNARIKHTVFKIKKIPIFYFPLLIFPTGQKERSSGFLLPSMGHSSNRGRRISQSFYLVLGRSADLTLNEDYFSERGFGHGLSFRTRPSEVSSLEVDWYFVNDRKNQGGTMFNGIGETQLPHGFRAVADFNLVSSFVFRQVFSDNFYSATQPTETSRVFLTNNFESGSFNFLVSREETIVPRSALSSNTETSSVQNIVIRNLPTFDLKFTGRELFNIPLYLDLDTSAEARSRSERGIVRRTTDNGEDLVLKTPELTQRLDFFSQVYFSLPLFQGLRLTPRLGVRETFYSDSLTELATAEDLLSGDNLERRYMAASLDLKGWGLSKIYHNHKGDALKHLIEPTLRYRYITGIDDFERIIRFDEVDAIANTNEIELALFNRIFVRRYTEYGQLNHEWLSFRVSQKYFFNSNFGGALRPGTINQFFPLNTMTGFPYGAIERQFTPVTSVLRFSPQPHYNFDIRADYDPAYDTFRNFSITGFLTRSGIYLGTAYFHTRKLEPGTLDSDQLQGQLAIGNLQRGLSGSTIFSYDAENGRFLTYRAGLNYFWDCCGISLEFQGFNVGFREERQVRFSFFLKGLGNFGMIRRPDRIF